MQAVASNWLVAPDNILRRSRGVAVVAAIFLTVFIEASSTM